MPSSPTSPEPILITDRIAIALGAAIPFGMLLLWFLSLLDRMDIGFLLIGPLVFIVGWCVYCFVEYRIRLSYHYPTFPSFAIAGGVFLLAFFVPALVMERVLIRIPYFCRAVQTIEWKTSRPNPEWNRHYSFDITLHGIGTAANHRFTQAGLNWTDKESADIVIIPLGPLAFQQEYFQPSTPGTLEKLNQRMSKSGLPQAEIEILSQDIWQLLNLAETGGEIQTKLGNVDAIDCSVRDHYEYYVGGGLWMLTLTLVFQLVGRRTLRPRTPAITAEQPATGGESPR